MPAYKVCSSLAFCLLHHHDTVCGFNQLKFQKIRLPTGVPILSVLARKTSQQSCLDAAELQPSCWDAAKSQPSYWDAAKSQPSDWDAGKSQLSHRDSRMLPKTSIVKNWFESKIEFQAGF
ncbi:uncharacterized protein LOC135689397 isoform X2 [Rhopilema esculentum]|uniref:uncharacterized protein LOC135689397 isoform X2 n=1 Tax=Rhopilema esculentum TaxID=499914 RepID=UPI0031DEA1BB